MANEHLKRTPTSTGNRKKWTWAGWVKLNKDFGSSNYNTYGVLLLEQVVIIVIVHTISLL